MSLNIVPIASVGGAGLTGQESSLVVATSNTALGFVHGGGDGDSYAVVTSNDATQIDHDTGAFVPAAGVVSAGNIGEHRIDQPMAVASLGESLYRDVRLATFTNFTGTGADAFFPWREWASDPFVSDKLKNFNFIRGSLRVHGQLMAPPLASGLVIVSAVPNYEATIAATIPASMSLTVLSTIVDCSKSNTWELILPWMAASNWGNLTDMAFDSQWTISIRRMTGVKAAIPDGCATTVMRVFAAPVPGDFDIAGPTFQSRGYGGQHSAAPKITPRGGSNAAPARTSALPDMSKGEAPRIAKDASSGVQKATGYKPSEIVQGGAFAAGLVAMYPPAAPIAGAVAAGLGLFSKALDYFGLTRSTTIVKTEDALVRVAENMIHADGADYSRKAALFSTNVTDPNALIVNALTNVDECSLAYLYGKYTHIGKYTYTVGDTNPLDHRLGVTPMYYVPAGTGYYTPSVAGYIGINFAYWRGDTKFLFYPVVSAVHRGSFQFIWQPVPYGNSSVDYTNVSINVEVPVEPGKAYEVTIGYDNDYPMAGTDFYNIGSDIQPIDYATLNGYLIVRNLNPITGSACGDTIDMHVFVAAGENMEFGGPTGYAIFDGTPFELGRQIRPQGHFQSKVLGDTSQILEKIELVPSSGRYPVADNLMGEEIRSLRALMMKPSLVRPLYGVPPYDQLLHVQEGTYDFYHSPWTDDVEGSDFMSWYGTMFLGFAGAIRYKYVSIAANEDPNRQPFLAPMIMADYTAGGTYPVSEISPIVTANTVATSITVPFYHNELFVPASKPGARKDLFQWPKASTDSYENYGPMQGALYRSIDESARFIYWRGQNMLYFPDFPSNRTGTGPWYRIEFTGAPAPLSREIEGKQTHESGMSLEQYRARTGRSEYKTQPI